MFITLEGPDGAGKTTFADVLEGSLDPVERRHHGVPERHPLEELELDIDGYRPGVGANLLTDRWYWSQYVYGPVYRNFNDYPGALATHRHIELYVRSRGNLTVLLTLPAREAYVRATQRGEAGSVPKDRGFTDQLEVICSGYDELFRTTAVESLYIDTSRVGIDEYPALANIVIAGAREAEEHVLGLKDFPGYIGGPAPQALLVGDRRPLGRRNTEHAAPFAPYPDSSGRYLLSALPEHWWRRIGIANACDYRQRDLRALWATLGCPLVVALGTTADIVLDEMSIPHGLAPHPQYWRRFHHWKPDLYGELIYRAAVEATRVPSWPQHHPLAPEAA